VKIVLVLNQPPAPEGNAPGKCALGLLRGLVAHGLDVHALAARRSFTPPSEPPRDLPVEVIDAPDEPPSWRARARRLTRPRGELARGEFMDRIRQAAPSFQVVHLEEIETAWCDEAVETPSLVHLHFLARLDRSWPPPWRRDGRYFLELVLAERAAVRRHRFLVGSSPRIATLLRQAAPRAEVTLAPLSLDPAVYEPAALNGPPVAGMIGTAAWPPTAEATRRLLTRVWPEVRRRVPEARLLLAGRGMSALGRRWGATGVEVVGEVPSAVEFLSGLSLLLFPLTRGSGMKVKVLESMATGLPVVTTPAGTEGIEGGEGIVVDKDDLVLAQAAARILTDTGERRERGALSRRAFEQRYTPERATEPLLDLYGRMAERSQ
jgi:polysaccharide biosynthesis protein PslH